MDLGNTQTLDFQFKEVESNINEREQEISRLIKQHNIPTEWFDVSFNPKTYNFETDAVKEAFFKIVRYQDEIYQYINTFGISRDKLQVITEQIGISQTDAEDAKMAIVKANLRLVVSIAKQFRPEAETSDLEFLDMIQEGNIGLMKAVDNFNYQSGYKFRTYATWWIRQRVVRAIANQGAIGNDDHETLEES